MGFKTHHKPGHGGNSAKPNLPRSREFSPATPSRAADLSAGMQKFFADAGHPIAKPREPQAKPAQQSRGPVCFDGAKWTYADGTICPEPEMQRETPRFSLELERTSGFGGRDSQTRDRDSGFSERGFSSRRQEPEYSGRESRQETIELSFPEKLELARSLISSADGLKGITENQASEILSRCGITPSRDGSPGLGYVFGVLCKRAREFVRGQGSAYQGQSIVPRNSDDPFSPSQWKQINLLVSELEKLPEPLYEDVRFAGRKIRTDIFMPEDEGRFNLGEPSRSPDRERELLDMCRSIVKMTIPQLNRVTRNDTVSTNYRQRAQQCLVDGHTKHLPEFWISEMRDAASKYKSSPEEREQGEIRRACGVFLQIPENWEGRKLFDMFDWVLAKNVADSITHNAPPSSFVKKYVDLIQSAVKEYEQGAMASQTAAAQAQSTQTPAAPFQAKKSYSPEERKRIAEGLQSGLDSSSIRAQDRERAGNLLHVFGLSGIERTPHSFFASADEILANSKPAAAKPLKTGEPLVEGPAGAKPLWETQSPESMSREAKRALGKAFLQVPEDLAERILGNSVKHTLYLVHAERMAAKNSDADIGASEIMNMIAAVNANRQASCLANSAGNNPAQIPNDQTMAEMLSAMEASRQTQPVQEQIPTQDELYKLAGDFFKLDTGEKRRAIEALYPSSDPMHRHAHLHELAKSFAFNGATYDPALSDDIADMKRVVEYCSSQK